MDDEPNSRVPQEDKPDIPGLRTQEENGGLYNPNGDVAGRSSGGATSSTGSSDGGASDSTQASDGGATDTTGGPSAGATDTAGDSSGGASSSTGGGFYNDEDSSKAVSVASLAASEAAGVVGGPAGTAVSLGMKLLSKKNQRRGLIGGGIIGSIVGVLVGVFLLLIPLKIEHIVNSLQDRFFATSENAVEGETRALFTAYIEKHVLPGYKGKCRSTIDKACSAVNLTGANPVTTMYKSWSNAKLENKLASQYGIEFRYNPNNKTWYLRAPGTSATGDNIGANGEKLDTEFKTRREFRAAASSAIKNETRWKQVMFRYKVGSLLETKYGIRRCLVFCGVTDPLQDKIDDQKKAAKLLIAERVLKPRSELTFVALACLLDDTCHPEKTTANNPADTAAAETGGEPVSDFETQGQSRLQELAAQYGIEDTANLEKLYAEMSEKGFQKYLVEQVLINVFGVSAEKAAASKVTDLVPVIGWINLASQVVNGANDAGPKLKKLSYVTNSAAAVSLYMAYRSYSDEIHTGHVTSTEVGSWVNSLGPGDQGSKNDPQVGGTATAESTPLYKALVDNSSGGSSVSLLDALLPSHAYAATTADSSDTSSSNYLCNNGKAPTGTVCTEEQLGYGNGAANSVHDFLNQPGVNIITEVFKGWNKTIGAVFNFANKAIGTVLSPAGQAVEAAINVGCTKISGPFGITVYPIDASPIPGVGHALCVAKEKLEDAAPKIIEGVTNWLIPNPFGSNMSGGRTFDMMAAGANVAGNDSCAQIGCQSVSSTVAMNIINQQQSEAKQQFDSQSLFARMFNTSSSYSLVSRMALAIPSNMKVSAQNNLASVMTSPFGALTHGFGALFSGQRAFAATADSVDPFQIGSVAFPQDKIPTDPEAYWDSHNCGDTSDAGPIAQWQQAAANGPTDPNTGMPIHQDVEPCLLIKNAVGDAGAIYDTSLLSSDEQNTLSNQSAGSPSGARGSLPTGDAKGLASQLQSYVDSGKIKCLGGANNNNCSDITNTASGTSIKGGEGCAVDGLNPALLGMLLKLAQMGHTFTISALCSDHHAENGEHSAGKAVDFAVIDGVVLGPNDAPWDSAKLKAGEKLDKDIASFMPKSTEFGQVGAGSGHPQCHPTFSFQSGFTTYPDFCHHQHVAVGG